MAVGCLKKSLTCLSDLIISKNSFPQNGVARSLCRAAGTCYNFSAYSGFRSNPPQFDNVNSTSGVESGGRVDAQEFFKWENGGGLFHRSASVDPSTVIEVGAVVHSKCSIGPEVHVGSGAVLGPFVEIGSFTQIGYNAALKNCIIGNSCVVYSGVCIGQDGFGFFVDEQGKMIKKPQTLIARIGSHVEIGANTCIDRGSWRETVIGDHSKIDNLVQIGHNVIIGNSCMLCGQVGIAGSVTMGDYVTLGGRVAIRDHVTITSKVRLAANSCVTKDISEPGDYGGFPAVPIRLWRRQVVNQSQFSKKGKS